MAPLLLVALRVFNLGAARTAGCAHTEAAEAAEPLSVVSEHLTEGRGSHHSCQEHRN